MTDNPHESIGRVARYARHVSELAAAFGVRLTFLEDDGLPPHAARAGLYQELDRFTGQEVGRGPIVQIPRVIDETTYAAALHEMGHCLDPLGMVNGSEGSETYRKTRQLATMRDVRLQLVAEEAAWRWARRYALEWTPTMEHLEAQCMGSYRANAARYGVKGDQL